MDFKPINYVEESDFEELLSKMHSTQLNSTLLESPSANQYGMGSLSGSPCSPEYIKGNLNKQSLHNSAIKTLSFSQDQQRDMEEEDDDSGLVEIDLNKTYSSKTMDQKQLSLMLAALEEDDDD